MTASMSLQDIFLTGATGVVGGYLLRTLLERTKATLHCLVRAPDAGIARSRLERILACYQSGEELIAESRKRVIPVLGDVAQPGFGLEAGTGAALAERIDATLHAAASTSLFGTYEDLKRVNVDGTANVIEFALRTPRRRMIHLSTFTVMGDERFGAHAPFLESNLDRGQGFEELGYEQSKFEAEKRVHAASEQGLDWLILRLGQIFGASTTGAYPVGMSDFTGVFYDLLKTVTETGVTMDSPAWFDVTPVDYACEAIFHLAFSLDRKRETFHLTNPDIKRFSELIRIITECGYEVKLQETGDFMARLRANRIVVNGRPYRSRTLLLLRRKPRLASATSTCADSTLTRSVLRTVNLSCPPIDRNLIRTYLDFSKRVGFLQH
jgi:thioester reductase-like protein